MHYFLYDASTDREIESAHPVDGSLDVIVEEFHTVSQEDGSFFGVIDATGKVLQFYWDDEGIVHIDIPLPQKHGSMTKPTIAEDCLRMLELAYTGGDPSTWDDLKFIPW